MEVKEDDYSNYSQAPTPVPEYRKKSCVSNITVKVDCDKKDIDLKPEKVHKKLVVNEKSYSSVKQHKRKFPNPNFPKEFMKYKSSKNDK